MNWWVNEISDPVHWDIDGLGIIDPRQFQHILELLEPLSDYGLQTELVDDAFYSFAIDEVQKDKTVVLKRVQENIVESEDQLFGLPNVLDEEKGPYADLIDHIVKLRVKMLNDLIDFAQKLTIEEVEEEIRETQNNDFMEGRASHFFGELTAVLEYVPEGFELDDDEEAAGPKSEDEALQKDLEDVNADTEEVIETDETMKWDEEEEVEEYTETTSPPDEDSEEQEKK